MTSTLRISRQQLAAFLKNDHDAIRQFETLFNAVANPDTTATATEPEIQIETAAHEALARIERLERAFQMLEMAPAQEPALTESAVTPTRGVTLLAEVVLTADQASISFSDISQDYRNLVLVCTGRGTASATSADVKLRFNGDTGSNYDVDYLFQENGYSPGYGQSLSQNSSTVFTMTGATSVTGQAGSAKIEIFNYSGTTFNKNATSHNQLSKTASGLGHTFFSVVWKSTAAITSITLTPASGNFLAGSAFSLYGEP